MKLYFTWKNNPTALESILYYGNLRDNDGLHNPLTWPAVLLAEKWHGGWSLRFQ